VTTRSNDPLGFDDPKFDFGNATNSGFELQPVTAATSAISGEVATVGDVAAQPPEIVDPGMPHSESVKFDTEIFGPHADGVLTIDIAMTWIDADIV